MNRRSQRNRKRRKKPRGTLAKAQRALEQNRKRLNAAGPTGTRADSRYNSGWRLGSSPSNVGRR